MTEATHADEALTERDLHPDPVVQLRTWLDDAEHVGVAFPEAMALATADAMGRPAVRHVLLKELDERGSRSSRTAAAARVDTWPRTRTRR